MTDDRLEYEPIGTIHTPFESPEEMPIQPAGADADGTVELAPAYTEGLQDLDRFSHCLLLYHFHESNDEVAMTVEPFLDDVSRGLFATRAPQRPNPIGLSVVEIDAIDENELTVTGVDVVDGTPLLDVKPFVPQFDVPADDVETGWLDASTSAIESTRADDRFV
ncbi:tRNA (N6-threonylcarbamoyladenosine(37)-N6)-methyltransferase TrmO [Natrialbaceae archaeon AArc-T1-2]|uniref:tRNA (N6-threonylcarbamoyladenosine(37)-N6)-methyltransferase TrmO n=1 Tax=Natrialbaceae archaeon AArc-T1-2 TaxID=3053904 RepID=UPI00255AFDD2|nr:tRNA (N6-threonylcarbamoyladenosine(37)-N6)-methyltransferase TrmO [Natrialbaceae archaeon AArc-T1-2]WIV68083.1 tRNA (N6-threonylcarbamoyladenosine(37)-N6)-methyltransferase TrmO [Natrialbaceae archaeon AArc-T1-2]